MPAPDSILQLVERFDGNKAAYKRGTYNETLARVELINPLFEALGWDMAHSSGGLRQVVHEDQVKVAGKQKAPDYGFYTDGRRAFFVEAKKPAVESGRATSAPPSSCAATPGAPSCRSASSPTSRSSPSTTAANGRSRPTSRRSTASTTCNTATTPPAGTRSPPSFGREAVIAGSLEQFAESKAGKRGTAEVDAEFLKEIERWRDVLARNIALRNPGLSQRDLNLAVQQTIDRIIFLRIAEDRGIEPYERLQARSPTAPTSTTGCCSCSGRPTRSTTPACSTSRPKRAARATPTR